MIPCHQQLRTIATYLIATADISTFQLRRVMQGYSLLSKLSRYNVTDGGSCVHVHASTRKLALDYSCYEINSDRQ